MASDLKINIDGVRLNIRVGAIIRHNDDIVLEISTVGANSVIPGGRIKINESSLDAVLRELKEELNYEFDKNKFKFLTTFENFFDFNGQPTHEIYFLYEYVVDEEEYKKLVLQKNYDNQTTFFTYVSKFDLEKHNLLPLFLHDIIKN